MTPTVAIVIPAGPGERAWRGLLPQLETVPVVLVLAEGDGCESGHLPEHVRVIRCEAGRARQLNTGARASASDWIWFLHADSRLPPPTLECMRRFVASDTSAIGYFRLRFLDDGPILTVLNAWGARWRSRICGLPFGDQGLLMPRRIYDVLGGFDVGVGVGRGEDHDLVWAARARNIPLRELAAPVFTSARRYAEHGWWQTTRSHWSMTREQAKAFSLRHGLRRRPESR